MHETKRTLVYVALAAVSLAGAIYMAPSAPTKPDEFADVGKPFYADFAALDAKYLEVVTFNEDTATPRDFRVEFKDGLWRIASHRNYPADGKDRLAKTAASILGIKKEEFKSRNPDDYVGLGVIDPKDDDGTKLKGRGQRLVLKDGENKVLADYIIGKQVKSRPGYYYVRKPEEKSVYVAKLDKVDLSTKFSDWIEADLLKVQPDQIKEVVINKYSVDEAKQRLVGVETSKLTRDKAADPWKLDGIDEAVEEVNTDDVRTMVTALDDLKIVGARPKPTGLSEDLKLDQGIRLDAGSVMDLQSRGFYATQDRSVVAKEGAVIVGTDQGVVYNLQFGAVFTGSDLEAEVGLEADNKAEGKTDEKADKQPENSKGVTQNRYLMVRTVFDPSLIGPAPVEPTEAEFAEAPAEPKPAAPESKPVTDPAVPAKPDAPEKPADEPKPETPKPDEAKPDAPKPDAPKSEEGKSEAKPDTNESGDAQAESAQTNSQEAGKDEAASDAKPDTKPTDAKPADEAKPADAKPADESKPDAAKPAADEAKPAEAGKLSEEARKKYEEAVKKYATDQKAYEEKIKKGEEQVQELNRRFADWYYVISADSFNKLRLSRSALVKPKKADPDAKSALPANPLGTPAKGETPDEGEPEGDKPEGDETEDTAAPKKEAVPVKEKESDGEAELKPEKPAADKAEAVKAEPEKPEPEKPEPEKPEADSAAKPEPKPEP